MSEYEQDVDEIYDPPQIRVNSSRFDHIIIINCSINLKGEKFKATAINKREVKGLLEEIYIYFFSSAFKNK